MDKKLENIIADLKSKGYFKYNGSNVKRYSKTYSGFEEVGLNRFGDLLFKEYKLNRNYISKYIYIIINNLNEFPSKEWWNYQEYIKASREPSFKVVLNSFLTKQYKDNQIKKVKNFKINNPNSVNVSLNHIMQLLINNDIFIDMCYSGYCFYKYDADNKDFIKITKDNFGEYTGITNKYTINILYDKAIVNSTYKLINLNGTVNKFAKAKKRELTLQNNKKDYEYIIKLKESFKKDWLFWCRALSRVVIMKDVEFEKAIKIVKSKQIVLNKVDDKEPVILKHNKEQFEEISEDEVLKTFNQNYKGSNVYDVSEITKELIQVEFRKFKK